MPAVCGLFSEHATCPPELSLSPAHVGVCTRSQPQSERCAFSPRGVRGARRTSGEIHKYGTLRGQSAETMSLICLSPSLFPPPESWSSCLRALDASGEKQVSPATRSTIGVARHWLAAILAPEVDNQLCAMFLRRWGRGWGTLHHHLRCDKTHISFGFSVWLAPPVQTAGLLQVLSLLVYLPRSAPSRLFPDCSERGPDRFSGFSGSIAPTKIALLNRTGCTGG